MTEDEARMRLDHAWRYFELHANQRISLIRYYIIFYSLYLSGCGYLFVQHDWIINHSTIIKPLSFVFIIITVIFYILDNRNRTLIHIAEKSLRELEKEMGYQNPYNIFTVENEPSSQGKTVGHTDCFRALFILGTITAMIIMLYYGN
jgi:hypothetical protein